MQTNCCSPTHPHACAAFLPASFLAGVLLAVFGFILAATPGSAATTNFLNVASVSTGGSYGLDNAFWNNTSETATPLVNFVAGDYTTIGSNPSDFNGYTIYIPFNYSSSTHFSGSGSVVAIYATNVIVTLNGSDNNYLDGATTFYVAPGSTLIEDVNWDSYGMNFNKEAVTLAGGGTITFQTQMGVNDNAAITQNMPGGTNNLAAGKTATDPYTGAYTLTAGTLNFTTAASATAFGATTFPFTIKGGAVDNTSGSSMTVSFGNATNTIGGNFTFNGSSSLDFGPTPWTNTANNVVTVVQNELALGGVISGPGNGLTLLGNGTLALYGANTYSGPTIVLGGTLALTNLGSIASSLLVVGNATLDLSGLANTATTLPGLSLTNQATLVVAESASPATNLVTTTLNVDGTADTINVFSLPPLTQYPTTFPVIKAATVNGTLNFKLGALPANSTPYQGYITNLAASGQVNLVLTNGPTPVVSLTWSGLNSGTPTGTWDVQTTPDWLAPGSVASVFDQGDIVTFNDTASSASTTVNLVQSLSPAILIVSNNVLSYTFTGANLQDPSPAVLTLQKKGSATLTLQENGDYFSGGINVSGGTVIVDNNSSGINGGALIGAGASLQLGNNDSGDSLPTGTITDNGTLAFNCADDPSTPVANAISGTGTVEQLGTNVVVLSDSGGSFGNWSVLIENGTLQAADNSALGSLPGGSVTITNGGTFDLGANTIQNNANFGAKQFNVAGAGMGGNGVIINSYGVNQEDAFETVVLTANATFGGANRWDLRNGSPLLNLNGFTLTKTNVNQISMVSVHVTSGNVVIQQGTLSFEATPLFDASTGTITVNSGGFVGQYEDTLGSFTRAIVLNGGGNRNLSAAGTVAFLDAPILLTANSSLVTANTGASEFFDGPISDGGNGYGLTISGAGTNWLSATNPYSGLTLVTQGSLGLTNHGSIANSALILVTNGAIFDVSGLAGPFTGTNLLVLGDDSFGQGTLNLGGTLLANFNYLSLSNAVLNLAVANAGVASVTVTNLNLGDGGAGSVINLSSLPVLMPAQFPLIKYGSVSGTYQMSLGSLPAGYNGNLVDNSANHSIDLQITGQPAGIWNGGDAASGNDNWSDPVNWSGEMLTGTDPLVFTGTAGLNNNNDTAAETANSILFYPGAGAFTLNGNAVALNGGITNNSSSPQTINLGLNFGVNGTNFAFNGGSSAGTALNLGGGVTNTADLAPGYTTLTLNGFGTLNNLLNSTTSPGGTNVLLLASSTANWTLLNNASGTAITVPWDFQVNAGTFNFGSAASAPVLSSTSAQGAPQDNQAGDVSGTTGVINMINGTWTTTARLNTALATSSTGIVNQVSGTWNIGGQFQGANGSNTNEVSLVTLTGGTMNIGSAATPTSQFYVASRGNGTLTLSNSAALNCGNLDVSRNANGNTFGSVGVVNLNGGTLTCGLVGTATANSQTGPPSISTATPSATFNFNGGTLQARGSSTTFFQGSQVAPIIPITAIVKAGGAFINDGGFAITIATPLIHDATLGAAADGGLTKLGAGTLVTMATNTYTGNTTVTTGTLAVNGSLAAGSVVTVAANGTLAGTGTVGGNVTVNGTLAAGTNLTGTGVLTCQGNVTFNDSSTNAATLDISNVTNNVLVVGGTLTYGGTLNVSVLTGTPALNASFTLFEAGSHSGNFAAFNLPALAAGLAWNWNPANGTLSVVAAGPGTFTNPTGITGFSLTANGNVVITGTNGQAGDAYYLLASTNLALPLNQWIPVATNVLGASGTFTFTGTNVVAPGNPQQFYILSNTNN